MAHPAEAGLASLVILYIALALLTMLIALTIYVQTSMDMDLLN